MHVIEKPWLRLDMKEDWPEELEQSFAGELRSEAEQIIGGARAQLGTRGLSAEARIEEGIPSNELLREVETGSYDLAIVGASGASDLKHTLLGSVAFKLAYHAPCSVAVVR
jgi:nucleotide-binding universal stress UspA family protein